MGVLDEQKAEGYLDGQIWNRDETLPAYAFVIAWDALALPGPCRILPITTWLPGFVPVIEGVGILPFGTGFEAGFAAYGNRITVNGEIVADFLAMGNSRKALFYLNQLHKYGADLFGCQTDTYTYYTPGQADPAFGLDFSVAIIDRSDCQIKALSAGRYNSSTGTGN